MKEFKDVSINNIETIYSVSMNGEVFDKLNNEFIDIYEATNGFNFVKLQVGDTTKMYPLHHIVCETFICKPESDIPHTVLFKSNNTRDCNANNLYWGIEAETWENVVFENIIPNRYQVSSHGNVRRSDNHKIFDGNIRFGYMYVTLKQNIHGSDPFKKFNPHRLVANAFCNRLDESYKHVNHIDGDKLNNHYMNLEWVTHDMNVKHAKKCDLIEKGDERFCAKMTTEQVEHICQLLVDNDFKHSVVYDMIKDEYPSVTLPIVLHIKLKKTWVHISDKYYKLEDVNMLHHLDEDVIEEICKALVMNNFNISKTKSYLQSINIDVPSYTIGGIKRKENYLNISDKYFKLEDIDIKQFKKHLSDKEINIICQTLIENNFNIIKTKHHLKDNYMIDISEDVIGHIKRKENYLNISDKYFKLEDVNIKQYNQYLTDEQIHVVCKTLVDNKFDISKTKKYLELNNIMKVSDDVINNIKYKRRKNYISDKYFTLKDIESVKNVYNNEIRNICIALIKNDFSIINTLEYLKSISINTSRDRISKIKNKITFTNISDEYFDKDLNVIK